MNHELAKTLTTALVQFIDRERPEGSMCCSNTECERLEKAFEANNLDFVEGFMEKKLSRLTEFEKKVCEIIIGVEAGEITPYDGERVRDMATRFAVELLALAKKELQKDDELGKKHLEGYIMGREETMREMNDFLKSHFNSEEAKAPNPPAINIPTWIPPCYNGGPCTNPFHDCINYPRTNVVISPNTSSGTSTSKAEG